MIWLHNKNIIESIIRSGCVVSVICLSLSMTGCLNLNQIGRTQLSENRDAVYAAIAEGNFVEEWTKDIPEGMEVKYVLTRDVKVYSSDSKQEYLYKFDDHERLTYFADVMEKGYIQYEISYDGNGNVIRKKMIHDGYVGNGVFPDIECEYEYNADGQLIKYKDTSLTNDQTSEYEFAYDENGHLISSLSNNGYLRIFEVNYETVPYYETVAVVNSNKDSRSPEYVTRYYNGVGQLQSEDNGDYKTTYEYDNGVLVSYTREYSNSHIDYYDANGNVICSDIVMRAYHEVTECQYNEHNDRMLREVRRDGHLVDRVTCSYEYDTSGKMISKTTEKWNENDKGEETTEVSTITYSYDEHGLLVTEEEKRDDGSFSYVKVYFYKSILVPVR